MNKMWMHKQYIDVNTYICSLLIFIRFVYMLHTECMVYVNMAECICASNVVIVEYK